jgi:hypothetical protein
MDEHRIGLKPITRGVWAPKGERPIALGHHRYEWLYIYGFVEPTTGRTVWNVSNAVCKEMFEAVLADFAKSIGVGENKRAVLQLDNAGWHGPENLVVPEGIRLVFQPSHSPELQPAEHLWAFVDEPLANTYFETHRKPRQGRRRALRRTHGTARHDKRQHSVPLVAAPMRHEVISRRWYDAPSSELRHGAIFAVLDDVLARISEALEDIARILFL